VAPALLLAVEFALCGYGRGFFALGLAYAGAGLLEGFLTMVVVSFLQRARPALLAPAP
jgi:ABC-type Co2+ transport system permease subunit